MMRTFKHILRSWAGRLIKTNSSMTGNNHNRMQSLNRYSKDQGRGKYW